MKLFKGLFKGIFWTSLGGLIFFSFWKIPLPPAQNLSPQLTIDEPVQTEIQEQPYIWGVKGQTYRITPLDNYEIKGLVVSDYDSSDPLDITHKKDPAQTKDLCLIWGNNLTNGVYQKLTYSHGEFSCSVKADSQAVVQLFNPNQLSNNHLIPATPELAALIKKSAVGDEVFIKGKLVNYEILGEDNQVMSFRDTSTVRTDQGCEIILVSDFQILRTSPIPYQPIKQILPLVLLISGIINVILFLFFSPYKLRGNSNVQNPPSFEKRGWGRFKKQ